MTRVVRNLTTPWTMVPCDMGVTVSVTPYKGPEKAAFPRPVARHSILTQFFSKLVDMLSSSIPMILYHNIYNNFYCCSKNGPK